MRTSWCGLLASLALGCTGDPAEPADEVKTFTIETGPTCSASARA